MKRLILIWLIVFTGMVTSAQYDKGILIEPLLKSDTTITGSGYTYPSVENDEVTVLKITFKPGQSTGWHKHEFPVFAYVMKGELTAELENGKSVQYKKNDAFSEVVNTYHNGVNRGKKDLVLVVFYLGEKGRSLSVARKIGTGQQ